jgi:hypothetical protein
MMECLKKHQKRIGVMEMDENRIKMMAYATVRAVMELALAEPPVTQEAMIDKLEQYRKETGNMIGKGDL